MSQPKSRGYVLELLESRCLLNGTIGTAPLVADAAPPAQETPCQSAPDSNQRGQLCDNAAASQSPLMRIDQGPVNNGGLSGPGNGSIIASNDQAGPGLPPPPVIFAPPPGRNPPPPLGQMLLFPEILFQPPGFRAPITFEAAESPGIPLSPGRADAGIGLTPPAKETTSSGLQNTALLPQVSAKSQPAPIQFDAVNLLAKTAGSPALPRGQVPAPPLHVLPDQEGTLPPATTTTSGHAPVQPLIARPAPTRQTMIFESFPSAEALATILPIDFSAIESSVKDFFDQIDQIGAQLSESQVSMLFSSGVLVIAATVALEMGRRKICAPAPALALQRDRSIPYSDYP